VIRTLSAGDLLAIARVHLGDHAVAEDRTLAAAASEPSRTRRGRDVYPGMHLKAAALMMGMLRARPFGGDDAAVALLSTVVFLRLNGLRVEAPDDDLAALVAVASGGDANVLQVAAALEGFTAGLVADAG
jgi:death-on-curing protein